MSKSLLVQAKVLVLAGVLCSPQEGSRGWAVAKRETGICAIRTPELGFPSGKKLGFECAVNDKALAVRVPGQRRPYSTLI